jgi:hypothetical protein
MPVRINEVVVDCADPDTLAGWWCSVLGWVVVDKADDGSVEIRPEGTTDRESPVPSLLFEPVPEGKTVKNRLHLDVAPVVGSDQDAELERLLGLGARRVDVGQGEATWHVLADPEGNEFCLLHGPVQPVS